MKKTRDDLDLIIETVPMGLCVNPFDLHVEDIDVADVARALSNEPRFGGFIPRSVAEHSVDTAMWLRKTGWGTPTIMAGFLHDGSEAYLGDMPSPTKHRPEMKAYRDAHHRAQTVIELALGLPEMFPQETAAVHRADKVLLRMEAIAWLPSKGRWWRDYNEVKWKEAEVWLEKMPCVRTKLTPEAAEDLFLARYKELAWELKTPRNPIDSRK